MSKDGAARPFLLGAAVGFAISTLGAFATARQLYSESYPIQVSQGEAYDFADYYLEHVEKNPDAIKRTMTTSDFQHQQADKDREARTKEQTFDGWWPTVSHVTNLTVDPMGRQDFKVVFTLHYRNGSVARIDPEDWTLKCTSWRYGLTFWSECPSKDIRLQHTSAIESQVPTN